MQKRYILVIATSLAVLVSAAGAFAADPSIIGLQNSQAQGSIPAPANPNSVWMPNNSTSGWVVFGSGFRVEFTSVSPVPPAATPVSLTTASCVLNATLKCSDNNVYWFDSCNNKGSLFHVCTGTCSNGACIAGQPTSNPTPVPAPAPIPNAPIETKAATNLNSNTATLNGYLRDLSGAPSAAVWFQWGPSDAYGFETNKTTVTSDGPVNASVVSLSPNMTYHFRAVAEIGSGRIYGQDMSFTAGQTSIPAEVTTLAASSVQTMTTTLNGQLSTLGGANSAQVYFEWGQYSGTNLTNQTPAETKNAAGTFSYTLPNLTHGATYHYRAVAQTPAGKAYGNVVSFTTIGMASGHCLTHGYQKCNGASLFWFDTCGNQQEIISHCAQGCSGNACYGAVPATAPTSLSVAPPVYSTPPPQPTNTIAPTYISPQPAVLGSATYVPTGLTNNFWLDTLILPLAIALIGLAAMKLGLFIWIEEWLDERKKNAKGYRAGKTLQKTILKIQRLESK